MISKLGMRHDVLAGVVQDRPNLTAQMFGASYSSLANTYPVVLSSIPRFKFNAAELPPVPFFFFLQGGSVDKRGYLHDLSGFLYLGFFRKAIQANSLKTAFRVYASWRPCAKITLFPITWPERRNCPRKRRF